MNKSNLNRLIKKVINEKQLLKEIYECDMNGNATCGFCDNGSGKGNLSCNAEGSGSNLGVCAWTQTNGEWDLGCCYSECGERTTSPRGGNGGLAPDETPMKSPDVRGSQKYDIERRRLHEGPKWDKFKEQVSCCLKLMKECCPLTQDQIVGKSKPEIEQMLRESKLNRIVNRVINEKQSQDCKCCKAGVQSPPNDSIMAREAAKQHHTECCDRCEDEGGLIPYKLHSLRLTESELLTEAAACGARLGNKCGEGTDCSGEMRDFELREGNDVGGATLYTYCLCHTGGGNYNNGTDAHCDNTALTSSGIGYEDLKTGGRPQNTGRGDKAVDSIRLSESKKTLLTEAPFACPSNPLSWNLGPGWKMEVQLDPNIWMDVSGNGTLFNIDFTGGKYICKLTYTFSTVPGGGDEGLFSDVDFEDDGTELADCRCGGFVEIGEMCPDPLNTRCVPHAGGCHCLEADKVYDEKRRLSETDHKSSYDIKHSEWTMSDVAIKSLLQTYPGFGPVFNLLYDLYNHTVEKEQDIESLNQRINKGD